MGDEDRFAAINDIVRHRYETGEYGSAHFRLPDALWDDFRSSTPPRPAVAGLPLPQQILDEVLGIPVVLDDSMPANTWRLVDSQTGEVLHEGSVD